VSPLRTRKAGTHGVPRKNILQLLPDAVVPSKDELAAYWRKVAREALKHLGHRPLKLVRHVNGITFYHKGPLPPVPPSVHGLTVQKRDGGEGTRLWVDDLDGLLGLVEIGAVELHPWNATVDDIEHKRDPRAARPSSAARRPAASPARRPGQAQAASRRRKAPSRMSQRRDATRETPPPPSRHPPNIVTQCVSPAGLHAQRLGQRGSRTLKKFTRFGTLAGTGAGNGQHVRDLDPSGGVGAPESPSTTERALAGLDVVYLEDEFLINMSITQVLEEMGCTVRACVDMNRCFAAIEEKLPDLAVLDVNIHGQTSFEVADLLIDLGVPLLFVTGYEFPDANGRFKTYPLCQKPCTAADLRRAMLGALQHSQASDGVRLTA
jgi:CheY-like chemotaxis protein